MPTEIDPKALKVAQLRQELADRGLSTVGRKAELCSRLTAVLAGGTAADEALAGSATGSTNESDWDLNGLVDSAFSVFESTLGGGVPSSGAISLGTGSKARPKQVAERAAEMEAKAVDAALSDTMLDGIEGPNAVEKYKKPPREKQYFDFESTEMTDSVRHDLEVLRLRTFINPKKHYKGSDHRWKPEKFQVGTVVLPAHEYYSQAGSKRQLKQGALAALKGDQGTRAYMKRKFMEAQEVAQAGGKKSYKRKMKQRRPQWAGS